MSGRMLVTDVRARPEPEPMTHLVFDPDDGACVRFNDARRFGMMDLVLRAELRSHKLLAIWDRSRSAAFNGPTLAPR